jgi:predicted AAA+ superfamily ATPase
MIVRKCLGVVEKKLSQFSAVGLVGARQTGKTTLAKEIAAKRPSLYLDLENYRDLGKLDDPLSYFESHQDKLIILDEVQRKPDLFMTLRGHIDERRRRGQKYGQFLILGSASLDLLRQSSESLAGRIAYVDMHPLNIIEIPSTYQDANQLWLWGGFPDSYLAPSAEASLEWRLAFIKTYLERDIPQFGPRIPSEALRRLWTMLAHLQGTLLNAAKLSANLGLSGQTINRYIDLLVDLFLIRKLSPWHGNVGKRLVRSPKIYVRDSGILHALLGIQTLDDILSHAVLGQSWEGFVIDNLLSSLPFVEQPYFYRTSRGAEIDLVIKFPDQRLLAIEIKKSSAPKISPGFLIACQDIKPTHRYVVYGGDDQFSLGHETTAISLAGLIKEIGGL